LLECVDGVDRGWNIGDNTVSGHFEAAAVILKK
jgi:hypothetical protein